MRTALLLLSLAGLCLCAPAQAQDRPHVFRNATLYPISEEPIERGVLVVEGGTIQAVGPAGSVDVPAGAVAVAYTHLKLPTTPYVFTSGSAG